MESLPRTEQSLGTPQQHAIQVSKPRNIRTATTPNINRNQAGPSRTDLKTRSKRPSSSNIAKSTEPKSSTAPKPPTDENDLNKAISKLAKSGNTEELRERITADTPAAKTLANAKGGDLEKMRVAPRTLIASLEKYVHLPPEQLIGEDMIDLEHDDIEPAVAQLEEPVKAGIELAPQGIDKPADATGSKQEIDQLVMADTSEDPAKHSDPNFLQPLGMSFFERFALSTMMASETHLASLPATDRLGTNTKAVSTATPVDETPTPMPPVIIEDSDAVPLERNQIPPSSVSPGLDEMVISSTSQTDFDLNDSEMVFSGNVQVKSPRFYLRADKFIVHLKKDNSGMAFGEAIGNVVIDMRENGRPTGYSGLASNAVYHPVDGKITLSGWPKIRQQFKEHVAVTRDTKMILYTDGRVKTLGRNRTVIRK